jgi:hypothetical protein
MSAAGLNLLEMFTDVGFLEKVEIFDHDFFLIFLFVD